MRKGQTEMLGLVFIVLILALSLVLYMRFSGQKESIALEIRSNTRVNNMLNALMLVNVNEKEQMKDVLIKECNIASDSCMGNITLAEKLLNEMKEERENYQLEFDGFNGISNKIGNCEQGIAATPARFTKSGRIYTIKLKLC